MHLIEYTILTGFLFVIFGGLFLSGNLSVKSKFVSFPRSRLLSYILMTIGTCWFLLGHVMQLGEADFGDYKHIITMLSICILVSAFFFTKDFLAVRALSIITLLYSREVLDSAFFARTQCSSSFSFSCVCYDSSCFVSRCLSLQDERFFLVYIRSRKTK